MRREGSRLSCPQDEQEKNAHVDNAHHAVGFAALAEQVEVEAREPDREV